MNNGDSTPDIDLKFSEIDKSKINYYVNLLNLTFPNFQPTVKYLTWLYFENPNGDAVGYDAYHGNLLVGHYVCIPIKISGFEKLSLLSLNTAVHPLYRNQKIFTNLATKTFEKNSSKFANVLGVANNNSINGFIKYLKFIELGKLDLHFGKLQRPFFGSRIYSHSELNWRSLNPRRPMTIKYLDHGINLVSVKPYRLFFSFRSLVYDNTYKDYNSLSNKLGLTLDWRKNQKPIIKLPDFLKPSPLVLIFKPLQESDSSVVSSFSFPDFDVF